VLHSQQLNRVLIILSLFAFSANSLAVSLLVKGEVETKSPEWTLVEEGTPIAVVGDYTVSPKIAPDSMCSFFTEQSGATTCVFDWLAAPVGFSQGEFYAQQGAPTTVGNHSFNYRLSVISGSAEKTVPIEIGSHDINAGSSSAPIVNRSIAYWTYRKEESVTISTNSEFESLTGIEVILEPRDYKQKVNIKGSTLSLCEIQPGSQSCLMPISPQDRVDTSGQLTGTANIEVIYGDGTGYYEEPLTHTLNWDYRPPVVESFAVRSSTASDTDWQVITDVGQNIVLNDNEAIVLLSSPHSVGPGDWWIPQNAEVVAIPDSAANKIEQGQSFKDFILPQSANLEVLAGGYMLYRFDVTNLPDGVYDFKFVAVDKNGNASDPVVIKSKLIDRNEPELIALYDDEIFEGGKVNFIQKLHFKATDGLASSTFTATSISFDTIEMMFTAPSTQGQSITQVATGTISPNTQYTLTVMGFDSNSRPMSLSLPVHYLPIDYELTSRREGDIEKSIEHSSLQLMQTIGENCSLYETKEVAEYYANSASSACYVVWGNRPITINPDPIAPQKGVQGYIETIGNHDIEFEVYMVDGSGMEVLAHDGIYTAIVIDPVAPKITLSQGAEIKPDLFALPVTPGGTIVKVLGRAGNGNIHLDTTGDDITPINDHFNHVGTSTTASSLYQKIRAGDTVDLWETTNYESHLYYEKDPENEIKKYFQAIRVPQENIKLDISQVSNALITDTNVPVAT
jgi:hypothetical protein